MHPLDAHLPRKVSTPDEAAQLWWALSVENISFHTEDDPAEWVTVDGTSCLTPKQVRRVERLMAQAWEVPESEEHALGALRLAIYLGTDVFERLNPRDLGVFATCRSLSHARSLVRRLSRPAPHAGHHVTPRTMTQPRDRAPRPRS